jgi:hypothetical protein
MYHVQSRSQGLKSDGLKFKTSNFSLLKVHNILLFMLVRSPLAVIDRWLRDCTGSTSMWPHVTTESAFCREVMCHKSNNAERAAATFQKRSVILQYPYKYQIPHLALIWINRTKPDTLDAKAGKVVRVAPRCVGLHDLTCSSSLAMLRLGGGA